MVNVIIPRSAMLGDLYRSEHNFIQKSEQYPAAVYARVMRNVYGKYITDAAILEVEYVFRGRDINGSDLYDWLIERGYGIETSRNVVNAFVTDTNITESIQDEVAPEWLEKSSYRDRLKEAGVLETRYYMSYLAESNIKVRPVEYIYEPEEEVPEEALEPINWDDFARYPTIPEPEEEPEEEYIPEEEYETEYPIEIIGGLPPVEEVKEHRMVKFQVQASMSVSYSDKRGRSLEVYGQFWSTPEELNIAIEAAVEILNDYAFGKGYGALVEAGWKYNGVIEDLDSFISYSEEEISDKVTEARMWVDDVDYSRPSRFSDSVGFEYGWWRADNIENTRKQVDRETNVDY